MDEKRLLGHTVGTRLLKEFNKPEGSGLPSDRQSHKPEGSGLPSDRQSQNAKLVQRYLGQKAMVWPPMAKGIGQIRCGDDFEVLAHSLRSHL